MANPTERALKRKPMAVVMLGWKIGETEKPPSDREFEWFENEPARVEFFASTDSWNQADFNDHGDIGYVTVEVVDTKEMVVGSVSAIPADNVDLIEWKTKIMADPSLILTPEAPTTAKPAVKARAKKASPTKAVAGKPTGKTATPKVRAKPGAAKKATAAKTATGPSKAAAPRAKAGALKARLAEKAKADAAPKPDQQDKDDSTTE